MIVKIKQKHKIKYNILIKKLVFLGDCFCVIIIESLKIFFRSDF